MYSTTWVENEDGSVELRSGGLLSVLDASSHLHDRVCPSVGQSVRRSAYQAFIKINENRPFQMRPPISIRGLVRRLVGRMVSTDSK